MHVQVKIHLSPVLCVTLGCTDGIMAAFVLLKTICNISTKVPLSLSVRKKIFRFEWATQRAISLFKWAALIQSDRCWRKNREVMKDRLNMGIKTASWDVVSVSQLGYCVLSADTQRRLIRPPYHFLFTLKWTCEAFSPICELDGLELSHWCSFPFFCVHRPVRNNTLLYKNEQKFKSTYWFCIRMKQKNSTEVTGLTETIDNCVRGF